MRSLNNLPRLGAIAAALTGAVALAACGGGSSPMAPSAVAAPQGVVLSGTVLGTAGAASADVTGLASSGTLTVTVEENPAITATVGPDGSFTLRGLPEGSFTLDFSLDGTLIGSVTFDAVQPNQQITITVDVSSGSVVVLEEQRNGIGHGDLEIEGDVEQVLVLDPAGESRFVINGHTVVARPGETAIREGNQSRGVEDVTVGRQVHVKGVWLDPEGDVQPVLAHEIVLQGDQTAPPDDTPGGVCMIDGGQTGAHIELEGKVDSGSAASFELRVDGNRAKYPVHIDASGAEFQCSPASGPNAPTPEQCRAKVTSGAKVHVSGQLQSCDASSATAVASTVKVQK